MYKKNMQVQPIIREDGFTKLANDIIIQSVKDYQQAIRFLKHHPHTTELDSEEAKQDKRMRALLNKIIKCEGERDEIERFFHSRWFEVLTTLDGDALLNKVREMEVS